MKVVSIQTAQDEITLDVINRLEKALVKARAGEFSGIAIAAAYKDGNSYTSLSRMTNRHVVIAAVAICQHDLIADRTTVPD
jgi:hypothetical protein